MFWRRGVFGYIGVSCHYRVRIWWQAHFSAFISCRSQWYSFSRSYYSNFTFKLISWTLVIIGWMRTFTVSAYWHFSGTRLPAMIEFSTSRASWSVRWWFTVFLRMSKAPAAAALQRCGFLLSHIVDNPTNDDFGRESHSIKCDFSNICGVSA